MATKKRSKSSKTPAVKGKQKLSPLEEKLLSYTKKGQPVLLHGKDTTATGRKGLILKVHKANGGIDARWEYIGSGEKLKDVKEMVSEMKKAIENNNHDRVHELLENCKGTSKTWFHLNCSGMNSKEVQMQLLASRDISCNKIEMMEYLKKVIPTCGIPDCLDIEPTSEGILSSGAERTYRECKLFWRDGLLFIDNLSCNPGDINEKRFFEKIAPLIEIRKNRDVNVHGNWLVAYTLNPKDFPSYLLEQLVQISLGKVKEEKAKEEKVTFDDVKLEIVINWKGSYSKSDYKFFVKHKKSSEYEELELDDRFKPVLYRLVKGVMKVKSPIDYVPNKELEKSFYPRNDIDDAKKEITKAFVKLIGQRAKSIIRIEWAKGKQLMIPKKNITLKEKENPPL